MHKFAHRTIAKYINAYNIEDKTQMISARTTKSCTWMKRSPHTAHRYGLSPVCRLTCSVRSFDWVKALSQKVHLYGRWPVWIRICLTSLFDREKPTQDVKISIKRLPLKHPDYKRYIPFPQMVHKQGFSPVCVLRWHWRSEDRGNPKWFICLKNCDINMCSYSRCLPFPQISHLYGFSPVCLRMWTIKFEEFENDLPQYTHKQLESISSLGSWILECDLNWTNVD